jgi:hypothetical protein
MQGLRRRDCERLLGRLKQHLHRRLTEEAGHPKLLQHLGAVTALMQISDDWDQFKKLVDKAKPRHVALPLFDMIEGKGKLT